MEIKFISIVSRWNAERVLYRGEHASLREAVEMAVASGANLTDANLTRANLTHANLTHANLHGANLTDANLGGADLARADLTDANLTHANLHGANLTHANLHGANLTHANLGGANLADAPVVENIDIRVEEATREPSHLNMRDWHTCETTHCRAGWAIFLAGAEGKELEDRIGPSAAGALIYAKNAGYVPDFFATNEEARADIVRRADAARAVAEK